MAGVRWLQVQSLWCAVCRNTRCDQSLDSYHHLIAKIKVFRLLDIIHNGYFQKFTKFSKIFTLFWT